MQDYRPLRGIKILDLSALLPGPYCTMLLASLGAQVLKVESPQGGDSMRRMSPKTFEYLNAQKDLISLDLKNPRGRELFLDLAATCDVLLEGFRPGVAARLGVDFDPVSQANPSIIYCSLSGYGQDGPYASWPGHDLNYMGIAGVLSISGNPNSGRPEFPSGPQYSDLAGSLFAANAILAALLGRASDPGARFLDVSMSESTGMLVMPRYMEFLHRGNPPKEVFMARGPYGVFQARDGKYLTLGIVEDHFWQNFCRAAGLDELAEDPELQGWLARNQQAARLIPLLEQVFQGKDREEWLRLLSDADVPVAPVHDLDQWTSDPQLIERGFFGPKQEESGTEVFPRFPVPGMGRRGSGEIQGLAVGRDTGKWLQERGLTSKEIDSLREQMII
ncbi:CaiB/BaiF CoA transferase family protein [Desulfoferula mesophila]|uniref:CoA transferase n=1 Tax=Desulfoferula mesophila TaxID=3058419 RepID=A0AAU9EC30_9BACT|nr:CoA transferase [Desulfoferula mesophilus]